MIDELIKAANEYCYRHDITYSEGAILPLAYGESCMSIQSPQKVLDRILNYPHKEKGCVYLCGPHLEPCVMVRRHDGDCECRECHPLTAKCPRCGKSKLAAKFEICCM